MSFASEQYSIKRGQAMNQVIKHMMYLTFTFVALQFYLIANDVKAGNPAEETLTFDQVTVDQVSANLVRSIPMAPLGDLIWSPDSRLIIAMQEDNLASWLIDPLSGKARKIIDGRRLGGAVFSPDGRRLAYLDAATDLLTILDFRQQDPFSDRPIHRKLGKKVGRHAAHNLYWGRRSGKIFLRSRYVRGEDSADVPGDPPPRDPTKVTVGVDLSGVWALVDGKKTPIAPCGEQPELIAGDRVIYKIHGSEIMSSLDGRERVALTRRSRDAQSVRAFDVTFSPDGRLMAWTDLGNEHHSTRIMIRGTCGGNARPLPESLGAMTSPAWSPNGHYLAVLQDNTDRGATVSILELQATRQ